MAVPPPSANEPVDRFRRDLNAALGREPGQGETLALAVSGGADSMAMLFLAAGAFPGRVSAATVDHRLRAGSADEAAMVANWCAAAGVAHARLEIDTTPGPGSNIQAWAREGRYLLLKRWALREGAAALCTAHHADDQAETFLMRAARATGVSGLAGVRARVDGEPPSGPARPASAAQGTAVVARAPPVLLRPLLGWRRGELRAVCDAAGVPYVDDPGNENPRFDRTRFRAWLAAAPWIDPIQIGRTADNLAALDADLRAISRWFWTERGVAGDPREARLDMAGLPRGVARYLVRMAIEQVRSANGLGGDRWRSGSNVEGVLDALEAGRNVTRAGVLCTSEGPIWRFRKAPPRRSP